MGALPLGGTGLTPRPRRSGPCAAVSATRRTDDCRPMRLLEPAWTASHEPLFDTGAIDRAGFKTCPRLPIPSRRCRRWSRRCRRWSRCRPARPLT